MDIQHGEQYFVRCVQIAVFMVLLCLVLVVGTSVLFFYPEPLEDAKPEPQLVLASIGDKTAEVWRAPDSTLIPLTPEGDLIRYGKELIAHTSKYLGPKGSVKKMSNGMNCQNCHLKSGTKPFGNNYGAVASTYPKFRSRSGSIETMEKRINDCIERSLNGKKLADSSLEMRAIIAWFRWLSKDVKKGTVPKGSGLLSLPFLSRAADPEKGKAVYARHCELCHGNKGGGIRLPDGVEWRYPPLAGPDSYNTGAGLFRLSRFAGYVKANMPYGTTWENPVLSDEEAWDVAAYVNSLHRPQKHFAEDWPDISAKPFDHPFGPYADSFSERQHKYGPYDPINDAKKKNYGTGN